MHIDSRNTLRFAARTGQASKNRKDHQATSRSQCTSIWNYPRRCILNIRILLFIAISLTPSVINAQTSAFKRADALVAQENYQGAIVEYNKVSPRDGDLFARAIYNIGVCHYELWQTEDAIAFYKRAIELKQGNYPRASYALGIALDDQGRSTEARAAYEQALSASNRQFAPATYRLGLLAAGAGEFEKAAALFKEAASHAGKHVPASHNNHGVMLARLGFLKEAEMEFDKALKASDGRLEDAVHNLNLCRSLTAGLRLNYKLSVVN